MHGHLTLGDRKAAIEGLCSRGAQVPQMTNFYLCTTGKIYFFHIKYMYTAGHPGYNGWEPLGS